MRSLIRAAGFVYGFIQAAREHSAQRKAFAAAFSQTTSSMTIALAEMLPLSIAEADDERQRLARHFPGGGVA
jgi:hypothetical protein